MEAIAHSPAFAKKVGVSQSVGKDFSAADKGKKFGRGGIAAINKQDTQHGSMDMPFKSLKKFGGMKSGGMAKGGLRGKMPPDAMGQMMARRRMSPSMAPPIDPGMGAGMPPPAMPAQPPMGMKKGGMANFEKSGKDVEKKGMKEGSKADMAMDKKQMMGMKKGGMAGYAKGGGIESRGKTKGTVIRMASGGSVSARADGIAQRGKTKFKMC